MNTLQNIKCVNCKHFLEPKKQVIITNPHHEEDYYGNCDIPFVRQNNNNKLLALYEWSCLEYDGISKLEKAMKKILVKEKRSESKM